MSRFSYLLAYLCFMAIPAAFFSLLVFDSLDLRALLIVITVGLALGGTFDIWATRQGKRDKFYIWDYNSKTIFGFRFLGVPIEDFALFLILTPLLTISVWEATKSYLSHQNIPLLSVITFAILLLPLLYYLTFKISRPNPKNC